MTTNEFWGTEGNKIASQRRTRTPPPPPRHFLYLTETKSWWCEEGEGGREGGGEGGEGGEEKSPTVDAHYRKGRG